MVTADPEDDDLFLDGIDEGALARWEEGALEDVADCEPEVTTKEPR